VRAAPIVPSALARGRGGGTDARRLDELAGAIREKMHQFGVAR
jgi:hypothetical protein